MTVILKMSQPQPLFVHFHLFKPKFYRKNVPDSNWIVTVGDRTLTS